jgi:two-component sensor histidine kinase
MIEVLPPRSNLPEESAIFIAEFLHRSRNEYARAISFASLVAKQACHTETREALEAVAAHLNCSVEIHRSLRPPTNDDAVDLSENLSQLCRALAKSFDMERRRVTLTVQVEPRMWVRARQCWRVCLIAYELITNSYRHAFPQGAGRICVRALSNSGRLVCSVIDDGSASTGSEPGLGTHLVDALAEALDGRLERRFSEEGSTVTISFSAAPIERVALNA